MYAYNGTTASIAYNFNPDDEGFLGYGGYPNSLFPFEEYLFMQAYNEDTGNMLYLYDGTNPPVPVIDVDPDDKSSNITYTIPAFTIDGDLIFVNMGLDETAFSYYRLTIQDF